MKFIIVGSIRNVRTFAVGGRIRELRRIQKAYGFARWRKRKGIAKVVLSDGSIVLAELHWYEASGIGKKEIKLKQILSE